MTHLTKVRAVLEQWPMSIHEAGAVVKDAVSDLMCMWSGTLRLRENFLLVSRELEVTESYRAYQLRVEEIRTGIVLHVGTMGVRMDAGGVNCWFDNCWKSSSEVRIARDILECFTEGLVQLLEELTPVAMAGYSLERLSVPSPATMIGNSQTWTQNVAIDNIVVPAVGDDIHCTYTVVGLPRGISFDADTRVISGIPIDLDDGFITIRVMNDKGTAEWKVAYRIKRSHEVSKENEA